MAKDRKFFVGQKAFIEKDGEVLILFDEKSKIDIPGGKIQEEENDLVESLKREIREETNLEIEGGDPFATWYYEFGPEFEHAGMRVFVIGYKCKYVSGDLEKSDEHTNFQFQWVDGNSYKKLNGAGKRFSALEKYFKTKTN